jgi:hypothetical protein
MKCSQKNHISRVTIICQQNAQIQWGLWPKGESACLACVDTRFNTSTENTTVVNKNLKSCQKHSSM